MRAKSYALGCLLSHYPWDRGGMRKGALRQRSGSGGWETSIFQILPFFPAGDDEAWPQAGLP